MEVRHKEMGSEKTSGLTCVDTWTTVAPTGERYLRRGHRADRKKYTHADEVDPTFSIILPRRWAQASASATSQT